MRTVALICEYNPFHRGHAAQLRLIRERFGADCRILCLMSEFFVQRGEPALWEPYARAEAAVRGGADLVLSLPAPWSCAGGAYFASGAISLLSGLGLADTLCFGSEAGTLAPLRLCAERLCSPDYRRAYEADLKRSSHTPESDIRRRQRVYEALYGDAYPRTSNDMLGVEYLKALSLGGSAMLPVTHGRTAGFSASDARAALREGRETDFSALVPPETVTIRQKKGAPARLENAGDAILGCLRFGLSGTFRPAEGNGGEYERLLAAASAVTDFPALLAMGANKTGTAAHWRRLILNTVLGIREDQVKAAPAVTTVLAMNAVGRTILSDYRARRRAGETSVAVLTRPAGGEALSGAAKEQLLFRQRVMTLYGMMTPAPMLPGELMRRRPFVTI